MSNLIKLYLTDMGEVRRTGSHVAGLQASYAHDAHLRIDQADLPALIALQPSLDDNYRNVIQTTCPWTNQ